ncbi:MAG: hypothetical protein WA354_02175 [Terracidiphilus sp.]
MNGLTRGFWDSADQILQWLGRLLLRRRAISDEGALYALTGGALVCALFGGLIGFAVSHLSPHSAAIVGTILGGLLGVCMGILFGSFVETVDRTIKDLLRSLNSK